MITLQHTLVTLLGLRGNEREMDEEIQYVLLPDAIRRYCGPRQYSHFEQSYDGKDTSWMEYPEDIKALDKEAVEKLPKHIVSEVKPCVLGETTSIETFEKHNKHLDYRYFAGVKKHLTQDFIFDRFIREKIDCSRMYEDKFVYEGQEYDGKGVRALIADIENQGLYILAYMAEKSYGIKANQAWFDKHVKARLDEEYSEDLADGTYKYMKIPEVINERITNGDWSHLNDGPIPCAEYLKLYEEVIKEMPKIDMERKINEDNSLVGLPKSSAKAIEAPNDDGDRDDK